MGEWEGWMGVSPVNLRDIPRKGTCILTAFHSGQGPMASTYNVGSEPSESTNGVMFLEILRGWQLLRMLPL
jgi:hypothetical protein